MFYQKSIQDILKECESSLEGLNDFQVKKHSAKYGKNELVEKKKDSPLVIFLKQFQDLLVIILIFAAIVSGLSHQIESAFVIIAVIVLNALLGTIQALKSEKSLESLKKLSLPHVKVIRQNQLQEINANDLTIGDLVCIEAGDIISGDGRLLEANHLQVNESQLTGEVESIDKSINPIKEKTSLSNQKNMVFSGSLVNHGTGKYIVCAIGMQTEIGKIASLLDNTKNRKTPLQKNLDTLSGQLSLLILIICFLILILQLFIARENILDALMMAVALAVAAIPEALSSIVTIILSLSTQKMVKEHAIIKDIHSVESLGCISVICSDKTGTLTQNKMTVQNIYINLQFIDHFNLQNHNHLTLLKTCYLCNNAQINENQRIGDPTELALLDLIYQSVPLHKIDSFKIAEIPFDSNRKMMSVSTKHHLYSKGAPDILLKKCDTLLLNGEKIALSSMQKEHILKQNQILAKAGLRVLAFGYKKYNHENLTLEDENHLTFIGLISLMDPPRIESLEAVLQCKKAGIKPIMITGDHVITATSIAKKIGIFEENDLYLEGQKLDLLSNHELDEILPRVSVYARVAPEHKIRIVEAWQRKDKVVAMTGDGVNDAPALKQSDIGVAMGITGSEVAKDAANMILTDDNFSTIVHAIIIGRNVYEHLKNSIYYLLSGNFAGILCVLFASLFILPTPFYPAHLLFMNLITDSLPAIAIGMEKNDQDVLKYPPRKKEESLLNKKALFRISFEGIVIGLCTMASYYCGLKINTLAASTFAFATICLSRLLHGLSSRNEKPIDQIGLFSNKQSILAFLIGTFLLHLVLYIPLLQKVFLIEEVSFFQMIPIYIFSLLSFFLIQVKKMFSIK